jgi:tRNA(Ile)-lysidine synthase
LAQTAELLADEAQWLEQLTAQWLETHGHNLAGPDLGNGGDRLDRTQLQREPIALQRRVLRRWLTQQTARSPTYAQVAAVLALVTAPQGSQTRSLPQGAVVRVLDRWLVWLPAESASGQTEQGDRSRD